MPSASVWGAIDFSLILRADSVVPMLHGEHWLCCDPAYKAHTGGNEISVWSYVRSPL